MRQSLHAPTAAPPQEQTTPRADEKDDGTNQCTTPSFFKTLVEHEITVELKNEVQIRGTLKSVDQYLNIKLDNAEAVDEMRWPHLVRWPFWLIDSRLGIFPRMEGEIGV